MDQRDENQNPSSESVESPRPAQETRRLSDVVAAMLERMPADEEWDELREQFDWLLRDARYKPPELEYESWAMGGEILYNAFGDREQITGWQAEVANIFSNTNSVEHWEQRMTELKAQRTSELKGTSPTR